MIKLLQISDQLDMAVFVGINPKSDGLNRSTRMDVPIKIKSKDGPVKMSEFDEVVVVFDATSVRLHREHSEILIVHGR